MPFNAINQIIGIRLMGFVILVSGAGALGMAIAFAIRPSEGKLALMRPFSLAGIFGALCSFLGGLMVVLQGLAATREIGPGNMPAILMGFSEVIKPLFISFAFLSVAWLVVVIGLRRHAT